MMKYTFYYINDNFLNNRHRGYKVQYQRWSCWVTEENINDKAMVEGSIHSL